MGNQNVHPKEIEIPPIQAMFHTNHEYDLDIYDHKDISLQQEIKINFFQKPCFSHFDSIIENFKRNNELSDLKPRDTNCTESMSIRSAGLPSNYQNDYRSDEKIPDIITKELKCSVCNKKAEGVCALCLVTRFCKSCFDINHKNAPFEEDPNNIHKLTYYKKNRKMNSPLLRKKIKQGSIVFSDKQGGSVSCGSSATMRNAKLNSFNNSIEDKLNEKTTAEG